MMIVIETPAGRLTARAGLDDPTTMVMMTMERGDDLHSYDHR